MKAPVSPTGAHHSVAKPRKSINEMPPPSTLAGFDSLVRVVHEGRPATIYDQVE
jgi:hypothetical protein